MNVQHLNLKADIPPMLKFKKIKIQEKGTLDESLKQKNYKCCWLGLIEPAHGQ